MGKLWAIAGDEILVQGDDATSYIWTTAGLVWGRAGDFLPTHPPGFPLIAGIFAHLGVPWRLGLELLYLGACSSLAAVLARFVGSRVLALLLFTLLAWHPWTFAGFHEFRAEPFALLVSVALFAGLIHLLGQPSAHWRWPLFLGIGGLLFLWAWSRYEEPLVYGTYGLFALLAWTLTGKEHQPAALGRRVALLASPILVVLVLGTIALTANSYHFGIRAKAQIGAPGLMALLKALYRIKPERDLLYAPVTRASLKAACQASPTLKNYESALLDLNAPATRSGEKVTQVPGEFGTWLNWLLTQAFPAEPRVANPLLLQAASEINAALQKGQLPTRRAHFPIDPNWRLWAPQVLPRVRQAARQGASLQPWTGPPESTSPWFEAVFDEAASRRRIGASSQLLVGEGSITAPPGALDAVVLTDENGKFLSACPLASNTLDQAQSFRFRISWRETPSAYGLEFFRQGQRRFAHRVHFEPACPWSARQANTSASLSGDGTRVSFGYRLLVIGAQPKLLRFQQWEQHAAAVARPLVMGMLLLAGVLVFFGRAWAAHGLRQVMACLLLVAGWFLGRSFFYGFLKALVGWGAERYMRCVSPLFPLLLFFGIVLLAAVLQRQWRKMAVGKTSTAPAAQNCLTHS